MCWKPTRSARKSSVFVKDWCLMHSVSKMNCGTSVLWRDYYCRKLSISLTPLIALLPKINGIADFRNKGHLPILWKQHVSCRTSSVIILSGVNCDHYGPKLLHHLTSLCGDFYNNNLGSQVNLKHNIDQLTLKIAKRTVKRVSAYLQRVGRHFQHLL